MLTTKNKVGLFVAGLLGVTDIFSPLIFKTPDGETGPPFGILLLDSLLGIITVAAVVVAWRTATRGAIRVAAGSRIISMLTALPAFFVDVDAAVKVTTAAFVIVTIVSVVLMLSPARRTTTVTD